jgi:hypothetical protein
MIGVFKGLLLYVNVIEWKTLIGVFCVVFILSNIFKLFELCILIRHYIYFRYMIWQ